MTVRDKLSKELEQVPDSLVEEILDFCIFLKQRQQVKTKDVKILEDNSVLISEIEWRGIQETIYLLSIPKMRESIVEGLSTPIHDCSETLEW